MKRTFFSISLCACALVAGGCGGGKSDGTVQLKASHQWPGGKGDIRDEMVQMIAREVSAANVGMDVRVYPGKSLYKPKEQWNALVKDQLDITALPLAYAAGRHPEFNLTLMPGLVKDHAHAKRLSASPYMQRIKSVIEGAGVMVLADVWLAGGFGCKKGPILDPDSVKGLQMRAAGKAFDEMLAGAGASVTSLPSSEIYSALQTGVLDAANTSSSSFVSFRLYEQITHMTAPGDQALWFMYEPILMSKKSFERLTEAQQSALLSAAKKAEDYAFDAAQKADAEMVRIFKENGVEIVTMTPEHVAQWRAIAAKTSYAKFAEEVEGGQELLDLALSVE